MSPLRSNVLTLSVLKRISIFTMPYIQEHTHLHADTNTHTHTLSLCVCLYTEGIARLIMSLEVFA